MRLANQKGGSSIPAFRPHPVRAQLVFWGLCHIKDAISKQVAHATADPGRLEETADAYRYYDIVGGGIKSSGIFC